MLSMTWEWQGWHFHAAADYTSCEKCHEREDRHMKIETRYKIKTSVLSILGYKITSDQRNKRHDYDTNQSKKCQTSSCHDYAHLCVSYTALYKKWHNNSFISIRTSNYCTSRQVTVWFFAKKARVWIIFLKYDTIFLVLIL